MRAEDWQKVEEKLPEDDDSKEYLCNVRFFWGDSYIVLYWKNSEQQWEDYAGVKAEGITDWMEIEPPRRPVTTVEQKIAA